MLTHRNCRTTYSYHIPKEYSICHSCKIVNEYFELRSKTMYIVEYNNAHCVSLYLHTVTLIYHNLISQVYVHVPSICIHMFVYQLYMYMYLFV